MDKREFMKASGAIVAGSMLPRGLAGQEPPGRARTGRATSPTAPTGCTHPASVDEVRQVVKSCSKLRALGTRHSFNTIADSTQNQISLRRLDQIAIDEKALTVTVGAGVTYGKLAPVIDARGYALHNLASLPHISVAGAIATATHGSGIHNGNLATAVAGAGTRDGRRRIADALAREGRRPISGRGGGPGRAGRGHQRHAQPAADLPGRAVGLREPFVRSPRRTTSTRSSPAATASACLPTGRTIGHASLDQAARSRPATRTVAAGVLWRHPRHAQAAPHCRPRRRAPAPSSRGFPAPGTSACPTSA